MFLAASYSYLQRNSDAAGADYDAHTAMISLGAALDPAYPEGAPVSELGESGFYAGLQAGRAALTTAQEGPRGGGRGTVTSDFGDLGVTAGGFVGWRGEAAGLVFGAELDAEAADSAWAHKGNRDFALRRKDGYGASLIFGVRTARDALLYARGGAVLSRFETEYATSTAPRVSGSHDLVGMRGGFGIEAPVSDSLSARLEYLVSAWPDYAFSASGAPDSFAPMEGQARAGLVWRFGGEARAPSEAPPPDFDGFYGGLQIGHGALATENSGPRPDAAATRFRLDVTRASSIASLGAFAGYGRRLGDLWLGAEIESDFSAGDWNLERSGSRV
jgi:opacity protein-like surface antigen